MKSKFQFNEQIKYFEIDPQHIKVGLSEAYKKGYTRIRLIDLDHIAKKTIHDFELLGDCPWVTALIIEDDIRVLPDSFLKIHNLINLESLTVTEYARINFSCFKLLKELVFIKGSELSGLDKCKSLSDLYLIKWNLESLPKILLETRIRSLRISASKKLTDIDLVFKMPHITELFLQHLPKIKPIKKIQIVAIQKMTLERIGWKDLSGLHSNSLKELIIWTSFESLSFIKQLKELEKLFIWECLEGNMAPILDHPKLKKILFDKNRKHYSHNVAQLQSALNTKK